jgi:LCP family protein required for cell wall assembly
LLLGKGGDGHEAPDLTDTLLVASIDPVQNEMALLSIPRDLYVATGDGASKINAVYANAKYQVLAKKRGSGVVQEAEVAGLSAIDKVVAEKMGIPIHYHVLVDFGAFEQAVNAVGGVDVNITKENTVYEVMYDEATHRQYILDVKEGQQHFDGKKALFYSRSRHTSARGDFDRSQRQRLIIVALKQKILTVGTFSNPNKLSQLLDAFGNHVQTNMKIGEMRRLYDIGKNIQPDKIASLSFVDPPNVLVKTDNINGQSVVVPIAGLSDFSKIQSFVRNALKDAFLKKESANIAVYNGTNITGLAAKKAEELRSFGYTVTIVGNAPTKAYAHNVLVDLTNGQKKYTQSYLEKRLNTKAVTTLPDTTLNTTGADFVIIIGADDSSTQ